MVKIIRAEGEGAVQGQSRQSSSASEFPGLSTDSFARERLSQRELGEIYLPELAFPHCVLVNLFKVPKEFLHSLNALHSRVSWASQPNGMEFLQPLGNAKPISSADRHPRRALRGVPRHNLLESYAVLSFVQRAN